MSSPIPAPPVNATETRPGLVSTGPQTFAGMKIFLDPHRIAFLTTAQLPTGGSELMGFMAYNTDTKKLVVHDGNVWVPVVMVSSGGGDTPGSLDEHLNSYPAHSAEQVSYGDSNLQSAVSDLEYEKLDRDELSGAYGAQMVGALPYGNIQGSTVEAQIHYLKDEIDSLSEGGVCTPLTFESNFSNYDDQTQEYLTAPMYCKTPQNTLVFRGMVRRTSGTSNIPFILPLSACPTKVSCRLATASNLEGTSSAMIRVIVHKNSPNYADGTIEIVDGSDYLDDMFLDLSSIHPIPLT